MIKYCSTILILILTQALTAQIDVLANDSYSFIKNRKDVSLPLYTTHNIETSDNNITKAIIVVHGTNRNADDYFDNMVGALAKYPDQVANTIVIAPQFLREDDVDAFSVSSNYPYWTSDGWKVGSNSRDQSSNPRDIRIPSYEVLDSLIIRLANTFENLSTLVFTGHSAGGQLTNRYTASSPVFTILCEDYGISSKSIIANPGSYVYMTNERRVEGTLDQFEVPQNCDEYNEYSYGLEDLYTYHSAAGAVQMKEWYSSREVIYLMGELDNDPDATTLPRSCRAMLQGNHRFERSEIYYNHIVKTYGEDIMEKHKRYVVPGVGHNNFEMYHSELGKRELFESSPIVSCSDQTTSLFDIVEGTMVITPNPTTDFLTITAPTDLVKDINLEFLDLSGRIQLRLNSIDAHEVIEVSDWNRGVYILRSTYGSKVSVSRVVIQ